MKVIIKAAGLLTPFFASMMFFSAPAASADRTVSIYSVDTHGTLNAVGQVSITETSYGLVFTPALKGLPPGLHGFHLHANPSCQPKEKDGKMVAALAAGGHYDPQVTNRHDTPWGNGHLGDLPPLFVDSEGNANQPVLAPRLKMSDLPGRALIIHKGGDNHSDHPVALGGGGERLFCGEIPATAAIVKPSFEASPAAVAVPNHLRSAHDVGFVEVESK